MRARRPIFLVSTHHARGVSSWKHIRGGICASSKPRISTSEGRYVYLAQPYPITHPVSILILIVDHHAPPLTPTNHGMFICTKCSYPDTHLFKPRRSIVLTQEGTYVSHNHTPLIMHPLLCLRCLIILILCLRAPPSPHQLATNQCTYISSQCSYLEFNIYLCL